MIGGPAFQIREYLDFVNDLDLKKYGLTKMPSAWPAVAPLLLYGLFGAVGALLSQRIPLLGYVETSAFAEKSFLYK